MFDYSKYGFSNGDKTELKRVLEDKIEFESVSIDTYIARPYTFILRSSEKNVTASLEDNRVIIRRNDRFKTTISNFSFDSVCDVQFKLTEDFRCSIFFTIANICYNIIAYVC